MRFALSAFLAFTITHALSAQQPALVAPTDALTPAEEQKKLIVPAGFEVQLVASEPDIQKPMQMAFDAKGRIWVTTSYHYPFAAPAGKATDKLFILSDFDEKGKARKVQTFAADLNIPIGILPLPDCKSCIVSSVGEILKLTDTDDDGKYDKKEVLFGGFGSRDTHGMYNSYTLMPDGWVYACHGFNNDSKTKGKDGHEVAMRSGNTFRFKPDGSRIEAFTRGQVNPFGLCVDPWFNFYTADCHSKPITNLIPGATYESFGSTSDALGFGPVMFGYDPGGTGLCGLTWYDADHFPAKYKGHLFLGNVVTNRVNMCKVEWTGATPKAVQQPDLIKSDDPWFRPVDIKLGPDGAVYVNDFYNKIIGHYEVDLKHPGRDKGRGRMWRVVYTGEGAKEPKAPRADWTKATDNELQDDLAHPNITVRFLAGNEFLARVRAGKKPMPNEDSMLKLLKDPATATVVAGWMLFAGEAEGNPVNYRAIVEESKKLKIPADGHTTLVLRAMASKPKWGEDERRLAVELLTFDAPRLKRATVEAMSIHPHADFVKPLVELAGKILPGDDHMRHATRIALRNCLTSLNPKGRDDRIWLEVFRVRNKDLQIVLSDVALATPTPNAAKFFSSHLGDGFFPETHLSSVAEHVGRHGEPEAISAVAKRVKDGMDGKKAIDLLQGLIRGLQVSGKKLEDNELVEAMANRALVEAKAGSPETRRAAFNSLAGLPTISSANFQFKNEELAALASWVNDPKQGDSVRSLAIETLAKIDPKRGFASAESLIDAVETTPTLREKMALLLAGSSDRNHKQAAKDAIKSVPYRSGVVIATALAGNSAGAEILLEAVKQGKAPPRVLQEKLVLERLRAANVPNLDKQIADLTKGLPPADQKLAELIKQRTVKFASAKPDKAEGLKLFTKHCGACHKIGEAGGKIGPNLDGVGLRGLERLLEDTLDPNRNVDAAFRARVLNLTDGTTKTGLMLRVEGEVVVMADDQGKEFRVPTKDIDKNRETVLSPMPANFGEVITEVEFFHLLGYLLDQKTKELPKKE